MFLLKPAKMTRKTFKGIKELAKRFKVLSELVPYHAAVNVEQDLKAKIPNDRNFGAYRDGLQVARVGSRRKNAFAVAVMGSRAVQLKKIDAPVVLLYVRAPRQLVRVAPSIQVLIKYSPWTTDTLPFMPTEKEAQITSRKTTRQQTLRVSTLRKADRPMWSKELQKAGRRETRKKNRPRTTARNTKPVNDIQALALRLEFGLGTTATPHWRPALMPYVRDRGEIFRRNPDLLDILDFKFKGWKSMRVNLAHRLSKADVKKFSAFQAKLGL